MIAAGALGLIALIALYLAFGRSMFGSGTATAKPNASPTPATKAVASTRTDTVMPTTSEQDFTYQTTPVMYNGGPSGPDPGRNIFAFYEPPKPCTPGKDCPPPTPKPVVVPTPTPVPTPPIQITSVNPQMVWAGQQGFRLEVNGVAIPAESRIYFNGTQLPTTVVNGQRLVAEIQSNLISQEGGRQIIVQTPDNKLYSNSLMLTVQAPPTPQFQYVGAILRARANNDTAIFERQGKAFSQRLNDVIDDRFRLVSISRPEVVVEDTQLGFRYRIALSKPQGSGGAGGGVGPPKGGVGDNNFVPFDPNSQKEIPGIPNNIPRYMPPPQPQPGAAGVPITGQPQQKKDVDDDDNN